MPNNTQRALLLIFISVSISVLTLAAACEPPRRSTPRSRAADAGASVEGPREDAGFGEDAAPPLDSGAVDTPTPVVLGEILDECAGDDECGDGLFCATEWPTRFCTKSCTTGSACGPGAECVDEVCAPPCTSGARDCDRFGGACLAGTYCIPTCGADGGTTFGCTDGLLCDSHLGRCTTSIVSTGVEVGGPCGAPEDCRSGYCLVEGGGDWPGGYCVAATRFSGSSTDGEPVHGGCPVGSAIGERTSDLVGDAALCLRACRGSDDCRPGHVCTGPEGATEGICFPAD